MALPPELIGLMVSYITAPPLSPHEQQHGQSHLSQYATVDRVWQEIIEERTFSTICLGTAKRLDEFRRLKLNSRRKSCIRRIDLIVELEPYDVDARARFETDEEHQRNNKLFTQAIHSLLQVLASWPNNPQGIELSITAQSPSDMSAIPDLRERRKRRKAARFDRVTDLLHRRYEKSYLQLDKIFKCFSVPIISSLHVREFILHGRLIQPASCARLASNLTCLRSVTLDLNDECKRDKTLRKRNRNGFAALFHLWPPTVQEFYLNFNHCPPHNDRFSPEIVTENDSDLLSSRIREFSQQLTHITIQAVIGREVFWPLYPEGKDVKLPFWPNLVSFSVNFVPITPSGDWLFERDPNELDNKIDSEDSDPEGEYPDYVRTVPEDRSGGYIRSKIIPAFFNELYSSAGQAALRMPQLKYMSLEITQGSGRHSFRYEIKHGAAKVIWADMAGFIGADTHFFHPEDSVLQIWKDVASQHTGSGLEVKIADDRDIYLVS
ncbi:hypothetical protein N7520_000208 [Penicillium odoratum]|uniref:uncharacterized protein n=1 Tax=Penicillium odoratum TaxID=1167516 RepID=UPI0025473782|nr:uncharacterized protein N7520_000208 [Penicillium odoratum]KAJ5776962.1 hypothetical protein N7520_000208 [Penicillium odoratum]